jgi:hypothetical protein
MFALEPVVRNAAIAAGGVLSKLILHALHASR